MSTPGTIGEVQPEVAEGDRAPAMAALARIAAIAARPPGLELLLLHGSRARREDHSGSDWDLAYLADRSFDLRAFLRSLRDRLSGSSATR